VTGSAFFFLSAFFDGFDASPFNASATASSSVPHERQNFEPSTFGVAHCGQNILATSLGSFYTEGAAGGLCEIRPRGRKRRD
jgi:hypothetical protein